MNKIQIVITEEKIEDLIKPEFFEFNSFNGAVVSFWGVVRKDHNTKQFLFYECYKEMAIKEIEKIVYRAVNRFNLSIVKVIHRIGKVYEGESSVFILVHSKHRKEAFKGCRYIIDQIKRRVPIWKNEE